MDSLRRWNRPRDEVLHGNVFPSGRPKFDPFPTVTNISNADFCPLAAYHDLWYNVDYALEPRPLGRALGKAGDIFHRFVAHLKTSLITGEKRISGNHAGAWMIKQEFLNFAQELEEPELIWETYLKTWSDRKVNDLAKIRHGANLFFEVVVASPRVSFVSERGARTYPLIGRVDEVDLDNKKIIERTIKRGQGKEPPYQKDYQLWLLWKALCSLNRSKYPPQWRDLNFEDFSLIVETPWSDFVVEKERPEFEDRTHDAFTWIHDICFERKGVREAHDEKYRRCTFDKVNDVECGIKHACYGRRWDHPTDQCRNEMRRMFKLWCRALLHEILWERDLHMYQFTELPDEELEQLGLVVKGRVVRVHGSSVVEVEVPSPHVASVSASSKDEVRQISVIFFGTLSLGLRTEASVKDQEGNRLIIKLMNKPAHISDQALIISDFLLFREPPVFLTKYQQSDLYWLMHKGKQRLDEASKLSPLQLLESIFGPKGLRRQGSDE